ncbi:cell division protein ZipA [Thalassotalea fusca]
MEDNFRNALIIISAIVIAAIFVHGFWTIRKNKNPYKLKAKHETAEPEVRGFDNSGFDQDGVGKPRVVSANTLNEDEIPKEPAPAPTYEPEPLPKDIKEDNQEVLTLEPSLGDLSDINEQPPVDDTPLPAQVSEEKPIQEVYESPISEAKPSVRKKNVRNTGANAKRNQMEINFGDEYDAIEENAQQQSHQKNKQEDTKPANEIEQQVIVVSVVMPENLTISGAALLPSLLTLGLRYGEMNIFHRHEDNAGNGKVTFSLANMMNPGTFDLDQLETFTTQGISLFMTLPNAGDPFEVFEQMMSAAKQLAMEFHGQLLDDKRSVMTKQTEQHYISKIREFERMNRIATA